MMNRRQLLSTATIVPAAALVMSGRAANAKAADVDAIIAANQAFYDALSARDIKAMEAIWANRPYVVNIGPKSKTVAVGYEEAVKKYWSNAFDFFSAMKASNTSIAQVHSEGHIAWVIGTEDATLQPKNGGEPLKFNAFATNHL